MPALAISTYSLRGRKSIQEFIDLAERLEVEGIELGSDAHWPDVLSEGDRSAIKKTWRWQTPWELNRCR